MDKKIIDELTIFLEDKSGNEFDLFNEFVQSHEYKFSFEDSLYLADIIRRLIRLDKRILKQTINITKGR